MKKLLLILSLALIFVSLCGQTEEWLWAKQVGGIGTDIGYYISTDACGNSYVTGSFSGTATFQNITIDSSGGDDIFIAKFDNSGNCLWVKRAGGSGNDFSRSIDIDVNGDLYFCGSFRDSALFGSTQLISSGGPDIFISKLDCDGNWLWSVRAGGISYDQGRGIVFNQSGSIFVTGFFSGTALFDDMSLSTTNSNDWDCFIGKLNSNGNWLWVKKAGGIAEDSGLCINADSIGNSYISGYFYGTATFGSISLTSSGSHDIFIAKLDNNGNWLWAKKAGGTGQDEAMSIAVDTNGNCYVTGLFNNTATFGSTSLTSSGSSDIFIAKLDPNGNWLWVKNAGGTSGDRGYSIANDASGNSYLTGDFIGTAFFGIISLISSGSSDIYIAKLDTSGNWLWAKRAGGTSGDYGISIDIDANGNSYLTGYFIDTAVFGSTSIISSDSWDIFIAKVGTQFPLYQLISPNGTEQWIAGSTQTISWNSISGNQINILLSLDNGLTWNQLNPTPVDASLGSYEFTVPFVNSDQCLVKVESTENSQWYDVSDAVFSIYILPPSVDFEADITSGLQPLQVQFTDQSSAGSGILTSWAWDFGDGGSSSLQHPLYVYQEPGLYSVTLSVTNSADSTSSLIRQDYINVLPRYPLIQTNPQNSINFGSVYLGSSSDGFPLWIKNTGTADLLLSSFSFGQPNSAFALAEPPLPVSLVEGDSLAFLLVFTPQGPGTAIDEMSIHSNAFNNPVYAIGLRGSGVYVPPQAPENVNSHLEGYNMVISWDAVTQTVLNTPIQPDYYLVFYNGSQDPEGQFYFHGATPNLSYTHYLVGLHAPHMFYRVRAYKYYGRQQSALLSLQPGVLESEVLAILRKADSPNGISDSFNARFPSPEQSDN